MRTFPVLAAAGLAMTSGATAQTYVMVADSTNDRISLLSPVDGSVVNLSFITSPASPAFNLPKDVQQVNNEIWVSDQNADTVFIFGLDGAFLQAVGGGATGGLDNIRGIGFNPATGRVYVSNGGTANGSPGPSVVIIDVATRAIVGSILGVGTSPFDVLALTPDELLISNSSGAVDVAKFTISTATPTTWHSGTIVFAEKIVRRPSNGRLMIAGFTTPAGLYEYDDGGVQQSFTAFSGARAFLELQNGNLLWTSSAGVQIYDIVANTSTPTIVTTGAQFMGLLTIPQGCYPNCDGSTVQPVLTVADFGCFLNAFAAGDSYANCDGSTVEPVLTVADFGCFLNAFAAGCT